MNREDIPQLIERWQNVERVLVNMPEHERDKHWKMSTWGRTTECGTVACAAGHCGLDPWFQSQGLTLEPVPQYSEQTATFSGRQPEDILPEFFGMAGYDNIFANGIRRPIGKVIEEVREHIAWLKEFQSSSDGAPK